MQIYATLLFLTISYLGSSQTIAITRDYSIIEGSGDTINQIINSQKEGKWIYYPAPLGIASCSDCLENYYSWYPLPYIISTGDYLNNKKQGIWVGHHPSGTISRISYFKNGIRIGKSLAFYNDGQLKSECIWKNGLSVDQTIYYKNLIRWFHANYQGKVIKQFEIFYTNGSLRYQGFNVHDWHIESLYRFDLAKNKVLRHDQKYMELIFKSGLYDFIQF